MPGDRSSRSLPAGPLAAGAMLAALALIIGLASYYLPVVGSALALVTPLPAAVAAVRYGTRLAVLTTIAATLIAVPVGGPLAAVFVLSSCTMGAALGHGMARGWKVSATLMLGSVAFAGSLALTVLAAVLVLGPVVLSTIGEAGALALEAAASALRTMGRTADVEAFESTASLIRQHAPAAAAVSAIPGGFAWAFIWYSVCAPILRRLGHPVPAPGPPVPVARWTLPPAAGMVLLGALLVTVFVSPRLGPGSSGLLVAQAVFNWASLAFVFQGLGLAAHLVTGFGLAPPARRLLVFGAFAGVLVVPLLAQLVLFVGMFDLALGYRARAAPSSGKPQPGGGLRRAAEVGPDIPASVGEEFRRGESVQGGPADAAGDRESRQEKRR